MFLYFSVVLLVLVLIMIPFRHLYIAITLMCISTAMAYSLGYPYLYYVVRGYYPCGFKLPKEKVERLTNATLMQSNIATVSKYNHILRNNIILMSHLDSNAASVYHDIKYKQLHFINWI